MIRTFQALREVDPGFTEPERVQTFRVTVPDAVAAEPDHVLQTLQQIEETLAAVHGVSSIGVTSSITLDGFDSNDPVFVEHLTPEGGQMPPLRRYKWIGPGYFRTMGNQLV